MSGKKNKWALGAMFGAIAGYTTGVLTAPRSGKRTRSKIKLAGLNSIQEVEERLEELRKELDSAVAEARQLAEKLSDRGKESLELALDRSNQAKNKADELINAVRSGKVENSDLEKAVQEADAALRDLKKFITKK